MANELRAMTARATLFVFLCNLGCGKQEASETPSLTSAWLQQPPASDPSPAPPTKPPAKSGSTEGAGSTLRLVGIEFKVPPDWVADAIAPGPMAPKAAYKLAKSGADAQDGTLRITHYPEMKGKDEANITRWLSQVRRPDGKPATREDAKITVAQLGAIQLTLFDISGTVSSTMDGSGTGTPNQRLINAILDHPKGPHFVRAAGGSTTMEKWAPAIETFIKGAVIAE